MSKGTYTPVDLTDPIQVFTNTSATKQITYQVFVDVANLQTGDILNIKLESDTASAPNTFLSQDITLESLEDDDMVVSYPVLMDIDDTFSVVLEQTAGTIRTFGWAVNYLEL